MYEQKVTLSNEIGLHARPASIFIRQAVKFPCDITVEKTGRSYNAKSIMSVLSMSASKGDEIIIRADGQAEDEAVNTLVDLVENRLSDYWWLYILLIKRTIYLARFFILILYEILAVYVYF